MEQVIKLDVKEEPDAYLYFKTNSDSQQSGENIIKNEPLDVAVEYLEENLDGISEIIMEEIKYDIDPLNIETFNSERQNLEQINRLEEQTDKSTGTLCDTVLLCDRCPFTHRHEKNLKRHFLRCHTKEVLKCGNCNFTTKTPEYMRYHMFKHDAKDVRRAICEYCSFRSQSVAGLRNHVYWKHPCHRTQC